MLESTRLKKFEAASQRIGGYQGALALLDQLPDLTARRVLKPAMQAADLVGKNAAEAEARAHATLRRRHGVHLFQTTGAAEAVRGSLVVAKVGYFGQGGAHGWLAEHGHRLVAGGTAKRINRTRLDSGKADRAASPANTGKGRVVGQVPPHPILLPAYEKSKERMEQVFAAEVITRADKAARQLAKQTGAI